MWCHHVLPGAIVPPCVSRWRCPLHACPGAILTPCMCPGSSVPPSLPLIPVLSASTPPPRWDPVRPVVQELGVTALCAPMQQEHACTRVHVGTCACACVQTRTPCLHTSSHTQTSLSQTPMCRHAQCTYVAHIRVHPLHTRMACVCTFWPPPPVSTQGTAPT